MKIYRVLIFFILLLFLSSCTSSKETCSTFNYESFETQILDSTAFRTYKVNVYHNNGFVTKVKSIENYILVEGSIDDFKFSSEVNKITFSDERFNYDGFEYSDEITDSSFEFIMTFDYTKLDLKEITENKNDLIPFTNIVNSDNKIPYDKIYKELIDIGFELEDN
ncbi:MAG: hypothetical protein FH751_10040 [Firmicutes bacterium]|nr:hypothetical protein [Bacillota bacterium]